MALTSRKPERGVSLWRSDPFSALRDEMNELRSRCLGEDDGLFSGAMVPAMDVSETDNAVEVRMDLPGMAAKDLDIHISGNMLTIKGQRNEGKEEKGRTFHRCERRYGSFQRTITLPTSIAENEVAAECHNGELTITLPKAEDAKARKNTVKE